MGNIHVEIPEEVSWEDNEYQIDNTLVVENDTLRLKDFVEYEINFDEYEEGNTPDNWSNVARNSDFVVYEDSSGVNEKVLRRTPEDSSSGPSVLKWDDVSIYDVDLTASIRNADTNGTDRAWHGIIVRGKETNDLDGYVVEISRQGGDEQFIVSRYKDAPDDENIRPDTTSFDLYSENVSSHSSNEWYYLRIQVIGSELKSKWWREGEEEPDEWSFTYEDDSPLEEGFVGVIVTGNLRDDIDARWDVFNVTDLSIPEDGERVSEPISLGNLESISDSNVSWDSDTPGDTSLTILIGFTEDNKELPQDWSEATQDSSIPGIKDLENFQDKYLWMKQYLESDGENSPVVKSLELSVSDFVGVISGEISMSDDATAKLRAISKSGSVFTKTIDSPGEYELEVGQTEEPYHVIIEVEEDGKREYVESHWGVMPKEKDD